MSTEPLPENVGHALKAGYRWLRIYWDVPGTSHFAYSTNLDRSPEDRLLVDWAHEIHRKDRQGVLTKISIVAPDRIESPDPEKFELTLWEAA